MATVWTVLLDVQWGLFVIKKVIIVTHSTKWTSDHWSLPCVLCCGIMRKATRCRAVLTYTLCLGSPSTLYPATGYRPTSATVVSAEPFSHGTGTLRCLQKEMVTYRHWSVSLWRDPDDVSHCRILSPDKTEWRLISATLCGWRRCFMADQLWFMSRNEHIQTTDYYKATRW